VGFDGRGFVVAEIVSERSLSTSTLLKAAMAFFLRYSGEGFSVSLAAISQGYKDSRLSKTCIYAAGRKRERIY
jgi:hypothetical protein